MPDALCPPCTSDAHSQADLHKTLARQHVQPPLTRPITSEIIHTHLQAQKEAQAEGLPADQAQEQEFDSNCITPGTPFMQRLGAHLRFFIRRKLATDAVWQQPEVVFSGVLRLLGEL